ncbi:MAG: hypothetical protein LBR25_00615 [Erysipelotrichaceae bacterium]|jgi:hypothetical protein|nr:hypothetical protein [Erysipelotrichaceae bacterium]
MAKTLYTYAGAILKDAAEPKQVTAIFTVNSTNPDRIHLTHVHLGVLRNKMIEGYPDLIRFSELDKIELCPDNGFNDGKHVAFRFKSGDNLIYYFKRAAKAKQAVAKLNELKAASDAKGI